MATRLEVHPAAAIFPMLSDEELTELGESIKAHGLRERIRVLPDPDRPEVMVVLDGRNRLEAIRRVLKVADDVIIEDFTEVAGMSLDVTPEEYVVMANIERRNLTQPQRRELAGKLAEMLSERQKDLPKEKRRDTLADAARMAGVSRRTAASAKKEARRGVKPAAKRNASPASPRAIIGQMSKIRDALRLKRDLQRWTTPELREVYARAKDVCQRIEELDKARPERERIVQ